MKIAVISTDANYLVNFRGQLMAEMVMRGHEVLAFSPDHDADSRAVLTGLGIQPIDYSMSKGGTNPISEFGAVMQLRRLLRHHRPDVCFSYGVKPVTYGIIAATLAGVPRRYGLYAGLGFAFTDVEGRNRKRRLLQRIVVTLARMSATRCDRVMFQNPDDMAEFVARKIVPSDKAVLVGPTGVDLDEWLQSPLPDGAMTFVLVARLLRDKGIGEYAEAASILRRTYPDARFLLLGQHDHNPASISRMEVEGWVNNGLIEWPGHVDVRPWLAQAHVFVLPSYYREGVPRSTQEAMAMGRPIITTDAPGCRETVVDGVNGFMVSPRDPVALAAAMRRFVENPELIAPMGRESRRMAEERFDIRTQNRRLIDVMGL